MSKPADYREWGAGLWEVFVNSTEYTVNFETVEFEERINEPVSWNMTVAGVDASSNTDFSKENIVEFKFDGDTAFRGRITHLDPQGDDGRIEVDGIGMAYDLQERKYPDSASAPKVWNNTATDTIISDIVTSNPAGTVNTVDGTNDGSGLDSSADFRMDEESKLSGLGRLVGDYGAEWWVDENDNFNVASTRGGGASVKTYNDENTKNIRKKDNAIEGDFDGVVVKGYGDGDDQVKATAGSTSDGDQVLVYTDKTITSDSQAQDKADSLNSSRGSAWEEVHIDVGDTREVRQLGENVDVKSERGNISTSTQYRIVERYYRIDFRGLIEEAKLVCNDREAGFFDKVVKQTEQETQSQTRNMQGNRNTINEANSDIADSGAGLKLEFNIPSTFTEDINNNDRTAQVKLDYSVDDYKKEFDSSNKDAIDSQTEVVKTSVDDFGDVEKARTRTRQDNQGDYTTTDLPTKTVIDDGGEVDDVVTWTGGERFSWKEFSTNKIDPNDNAPLEGIFVHVDFVTSPTAGNDFLTFTDIDVEWRFQEESRGNSTEPGSETIDTRTYTYEVSSGSAVPVANSFSAFLPYDYGGEIVALQARPDWTPGDVDELDISVNYTWYTIERGKVPQTSDAAENIDVFIEKAGQDNFDASQNSSQTTQILPNASTETFGQLDSNDVVISTQSTSATQLEIKVNGSTLSTESLSGSKPYKQDDITIPLGDLNVPGFNTIELIPDSKAEVKGNVIVDHKIDVNR